MQDIFRLTPHEKQCMMFSATLSKEIRPVCRKFMQDVSYQTTEEVLNLYHTFTVLMILLKSDKTCKIFQKV